MWWTQTVSGSPTDASDSELLATRYHECSVVGLYNTEGPHSSLDKKTPDEIYFATLPAIKQAA
jgi:hypothetical protein